MRFEQFVSWSEVNITASAWIREPGIEIYVRKSFRPDASFEIANMNAKVPGSGSLTAFLDKYEPDHKFYIESILNPLLIPYFKKRGYAVIGKSFPICMAKP